MSSGPIKNIKGTGASQKLLPLQGAILDVDGTLLDSMPMWDQLAARFLRSLGLVPEPDLNSKIKNFTVAEAGRYFQEHYGVKVSVAEINTGVFKLARQFYVNEVPLKPGVQEFLAFLAERRIPMCLATVTDADLVRSALERYGLLAYFKTIITCRDVSGKDKPEIFFRAQAVLGTARENTYVFEDAYYAMVTAKAAGFPVVAVADASSAGDKDKIKKVADICVHNLTEMEAYLHV
jgi:HAD superfamily hydrolase (TIGR01509 family)